MKRLRYVNLVVVLTLLAGWLAWLPAPVQAAPAAFDCGDVTEIPQAECEALVALYESTDGDNWNDNTGWLQTTTPCSWYGVTCADSNVTELDLSWNGLSGPIPPEIGNLTTLVSLSLGDNVLTSLPPEIGNLSSLKHLYLSFSNLTSLPPEIGNLTALTELDLTHNNLMSLPPEIGNLTALRSLSLWGNTLTNLPPEIGNLSSLKHLYLDYNELTNLPPEIGNLTALTSLGLNGNALTSLPPEIGNLTALTGLRIEDNTLTHLPSELWNLTALMSLSLGGNGLTHLPSELSNLTALTTLDLSSNQLSGPIPPEIGDLARLDYLSLGGNQLSGEIPAEIGNLTALERLYLDNNQLSGAIPAEIGNFTALRWLNLGGNQLTGPIPAWIGNLTELRDLSLEGNQLSGSVPPEIGNLTMLYNLQLSNNELTSLPSEIGNLTSLGWSGAGGLYLNNNQLTSLPPEIGSLTHLWYLYLHNNPFSGEVPAALTSLNQLNHFTFYDTDWCVPAEGDIPAWLAGIKRWDDGSSGVYGTGLICGEDLGSLSGAVTLTDTTPAAGIQVNLYRSTDWRQWQHISFTHTLADGTYQFADLGQGLGIDYRVQFVDPTRYLAPQYYDAQPTIATANVITITPDVPRTGIDAMLDVQQPPSVDAETESGSVAYYPNGTAQITMPAPRTSAITITRAVTCTVGAPSAVTLTLSTGPQYTMTNTSGDMYQATIPADDLTGNATLRVAATCGVTTTETTVGYITLYDPSGFIRNQATGQPVEGATVTLYNVPGWEPKTGPDDDRPNTCQSNDSKAADAPWSQEAPTDLGIVSNADVTLTAPKLPYQQTTAEGYYGWDVSEGCWYVTVEAEGYDSLTSPVVGVPPEVTDLNLALMPEGFNVQVVKSATPTLTITNGSAITYTLVVSASVDATLHLYDELDPNLKWLGFVGDVPETLTYTTALTGAVALSATTPLTVTFAAEVDLPAASFVNEHAQVSNTAYYYLPGETLSMMRPSNTVTRTIYDKAAFEIYLPLVVRES